MYLLLDGSVLVKPCAFCCRCKKAAGCNPCGHLFFKSNFVSPELGEEEKEDITNEKADLAFWYVLLIVCRQSCLFINLPGKSTCLSHSSGLFSTFRSSIHLSIQ